MKLIICFVLISLILSNLSFEEKIINEKGTRTLSTINQVFFLPSIFLPKREIERFNHQNDKKKQQKTTKKQQKS